MKDMQDITLKTTKHFSEKECLKDLGLGKQHKK